MSYVFCGRCRSAWPWCSCARTKILLLLALNACGPDAFTSAPGLVGKPVEDSATAASDTGVDSQLDSPAVVSDASSDSAAPYTCNIVYNGDPQQVACGGSSPFQWLSTDDAGTKTLVSCSERPCPWSAKCFVQSIPGSGVCAQ